MASDVVPLAAHNSSYFSHALAESRSTANRQKNVSGVMGFHVIRLDEMRLDFWMMLLAINLLMKYMILPADYLPVK
jgi:hypothetical protein